MKRVLTPGFFATIPAACALIAGSFGYGCGTTADTPADASSDAPLDGTTFDSGVRDAKADVVEQCAQDASIRGIEVSDASAAADAGIDTSVCIQCLKNKCGGPVDACDQDCECRTAIFDFLACAPKNPTPQGVQGCLVRSFASADETSQALGFCANQFCNAACIPSTLSDAGPKDATADSADAADAK